MKDLFSITDKIIAITGAGGVLCGSMAKVLADGGAKVAVLDLNEAAADKIAEDINANSGKAIAIKVDFIVS